VPHEVTPVGTPDDACAGRCDVGELGLLRHVDGPQQVRVRGLVRRHRVEQRCAGLPVPEAFDRLHREQLRHRGIVLVHDVRRRAEQVGGVGVHRLVRPGRLPQGISGRADGDGEHDAEGRDRQAADEVGRALASDVGAEDLLGADVGAAQRGDELGERRRPIRVAPPEPASLAQPGQVGPLGFAVDPVGERRGERGGADLVDRAR
jgi:hypothetical protein